MQSVKAWHFAAENNRLTYGDDREIVIGETHTVSTEEKDLELCEWGLHASERIIDALQYARGPKLYKVELSGQIIVGDDKIVATERTYLAGIDATDILRESARLCALDVIHLWDPDDIVIEFLKTGNEEIKVAASESAGAAVRKFEALCGWVGQATWAAARSAAWAGDFASVWAVVSRIRSYRITALAAARGAAHEAACALANIGTNSEADYAAAIEAQNKRLTDMVNASFRRCEPQAKNSIVNDC